MTRSSASLAGLSLRPIAPTPLSESLPRLESLLSPYVGVVQAAAETLRGPDDARLVTVGCALGDGHPVIGAQTVEHTGGTNLMRPAARAAALGEAAERYSAAYVAAERSVRATARELGAAAADPDRFALFHERQYRRPGFPFVPFDRDTRLRWVQGWRLPDGEPAFLPAQLVFLQGPVEDEPAVAYATSNGVACGPTPEEAILAGLCEVAERDAFMLTWRNRLSLPRLSWEDEAGLLEVERRCFAPTGLRYSAVDLSAFLAIPTVLAVVRGGSGACGRLGVGAGCAPTVEEAWQKALGEAFSVHRWLGERNLTAESPDRADDVRSFDDHLLFYARPERAERTAFLDASRDVRHMAAIPPLEGRDLAELVRAAARRLRERNVSAYAVDLTAPDVRECGLTVMRVLAPELCALDVVHTARFLGARRLLRAAHEAGLTHEPFGFEDLNPDPHPFP